jgi:hypothetical protein
MQNYSGGGGVHTVAGHLPANIKPSAAFGIPGQAALGCITCHPATSHNGGAGAFLTAQVQIVVDGQYRFDKNRAIVYSGKQVGTTNKTSGTCSNVACHYQKSPIWSTQTYTKGGH